MSKKATAFGVGMTLIWSAAFVTALHSWAGIGVGICFGVAFAAGYDKKKGEKDSSETKTDDK